MDPLLTKLKHKDISAYREQALALQGNLCALCEEPIHGDAVLDHDHRSGHIRCVLHRGCNSMLGKIENSMPRSQMDIHRLRAFARNISDYIMTTHTEITHPRHKEKGMYKKGSGKKPPKR